jgi:D-glycero-D-manno-heptose 1,7-bisphosphate phosphatase
MSTPVIGLDRDGTINEDIGTYVTKPEQFKPIPGSLEAIKMIRDKGYDVVILTNQAGIMKGICDAVDVDVVHNYMLQLLGEVGCKSINGLYYSTTNLKDDIYAKPNIGMFKRAAAEIGVDWKNGVYVGDKITDLKAAVKAKTRPVLLRTGHGKETIEKLNSFANKDLKKQTEIFDNLYQFAYSLVDLRQ